MIFTLESLLKDPQNISDNFRQYLNGFSPNILDILTKFKFFNQIETLEDSKILFTLVQRFSEKSDEISPKNLSNHYMGYVFEELIRRFNEENNEEAGEHFTDLAGEILDDTIKAKTWKETDKENIMLQLNKMLETKITESVDSNLELYNTYHESKEFKLLLVEHLYSKIKEGWKKLI